MKNKARIIAFYLPQYHPTPENDKYWGKGFTEWTNVAKAKPLFRGHYQPRIPADLGFYDLRLPQIREAQAEMARNAGIEGFMYWHYWFGNGVMTLQDVFEEVLKSRKPEFPFCLGWANHEWSTKTWTKGKTFQKDAVIFEMKYPGHSDWVEHFKYCLPAFLDSRYIKVDGKPVFYIWSPYKMPDTKDFIACWQLLARKNGLPGIHFVAQVCSETADLEELHSLGYEAVNSVHMQYAEDHAMQNILIKKIRGAVIRYSGGLIKFLRKYDFKKIMSRLSQPIDRREDVYPTIVAGYDRTARSGTKATIYDNFTPELFYEHVKQIVASVQDKQEEHKIIFLKSWNEWAEGNYVEPDLKNGHKLLDAIRNVLNKE